MLGGKINSTKRARIMSNGIHVGYKKLILKYLDEDREIGAMKIKIKIENGLKNQSIKLPARLMPQLSKVYILSLLLFV